MMPNNDRFLTRVFDKQEKKMIYLGDKFTIKGKKYFEYEFWAIVDEGLLVERSYFNPHVCGESPQAIDVIPFGDRFVPMQCTGSQAKNKKLIYAGDILRMPSKDDWDKINFASYEVFFCDNDSCMCHIGFEMSRVHYHGSVSGGWVPNFNPRTTSRMEIIGNRWEQPELIGVKE